MKLHIFRFFIIFIVSLQFVCCGDSFPTRYIPALPEVPAAWVSLLGEPHWRLEWLDPDGRGRTADILPGNSTAIEIPVTWANPVTAWPYWPGRNLIPGHFKPAGALFPFDAEGDRIRLSWEAGADAVFYRELALAVGQAGQNSAKMPAYFDWPRFRSLFHEETLNRDVRKDPWLVNWHNVAERTVSANFDRRRLVPETVSKIAIPVPAGLWYGASPFTEPLRSEGGVLDFPVRSGINVWVCAEGILRFTDKTYVFTEFARD